MSKKSRNYNKDHYTARGVPQAGAEEVPELEKEKLTEEGPDRPKGKERRLTGPDQSPEIARKMGT